jgi:hypothetical protein
LEEEEQEVLQEYQQLEVAQEEFQVFQQLHQQVAVVAEQLTHQHLQVQESLVLQVVEQEIDKVVEHNQEEQAIHRQLLLHKEILEVQQLDLVQ